MKRPDYLERLEAAEFIARTGQVRRLLPTSMEADGPNVELGSLCEVETRSGTALAEVVTVRPGGVVLAPLEGGGDVLLGARVVALSSSESAPVGDEFLGRAIDGLGRCIDGGAPVRSHRKRALHGKPTSPLSRGAPKDVLPTGVRGVDGLLTLARGQRIGIFAASGVGKTTLLTQIVQQVEADRCVICLVGERGREVASLWGEGLPDHARARTTLVAATADQQAALRVRACHQAVALAEHWREQGLNVLLVIDSVTRLAMALREIGLAAGEPPTVRAYTPSVFSALPHVVERCGLLSSGGAITAVMTVLSEDDDNDDPVCELMKAILDGHIILSRSLAEQGQFPAIDVGRSISRLASDLMDSAHRNAATRAVDLLGAYEASRTLVESGIYASGSNPKIDDAIANYHALRAYLRQGREEQVSFSESRRQLVELMNTSNE